MRVPQIRLAALALLSGMEWHMGLTHKDHCPTCGYPRERGHEPGCSLRAVLTGETPYRLVRMEEVYGDASFGYDGRDRKRWATPVLDPLATDEEQR